MHAFLARRTVWGTYLVEGGLWLMLIGLCVSRAAMSAGMGLAVLGALLQWDTAYIREVTRERVWLWGAWFLGIWHLLAVKLGNPSSQMLAWGDWVPFLSLISALGVLPAFSVARWKRLMRVFVSSVVSTAILMLILALIHAGQSGVWDAASLSYVGLTGTIGHHPTYFGLLINLSLPALFSLYRQRAQKSPWGYLSVLLGLGIFQGLLAARMQMLIFLLLVMGAGIYYLRQQSRLLLGMVTGMLLLLAFVLWQQPFVQQRLQDLHYQEWQSRNIEEIGWNGVAVRLYLWEKNWTQIQLYPWKGVGLGMGQEAVQASFQADGFPNTHMNAHNQYLHTTLELGLPGLILLLAWWMIPFFRPVKGRMWFFAPVALVILCSGLTEVILARQWGLLAATLFMSLALAHAPRDIAPVAQTESTP